MTTCRYIENCGDYMVKCKLITPPEWLIKSVDSMFAGKQSTKGTTPFFADRVSVLIDTSGSTNNTGGRTGGGRFRNGVFKSESGTDPIISAEIKGTIHYILEMMSTYDLTNVVFQFYSFSSCVYLAGECVVDTHENLFEFLKKLVCTINYEFRDTNLMAGLNRVCGDELAQYKSHIVIATDGQPNTGGDTSAILNFLKSLPEIIYGNITMALIGAGSIQIAQGGGSGFRSTGGRNATSKFLISTVPDAMDINQFRTHLFGPTGGGNSECNINFLVEIMNMMKSSAYLPAFGDYSELVKTAKDYFGNTQDHASLRNYKVVLENGSTLLPVGVQVALKTNNVVIQYINNRGWYMFSKKWQLALVCNTPTIDITKTYIPETLSFAEGDYLSVAGNDEKVSFAATYETTRVEFSVGQDENGFWRCRQVIV